MTCYKHFKLLSSDMDKIRYMTPVPNAVGHMCVL